MYTRRHTHARAHKASLSLSLLTNNVKSSFKNQFSLKYSEFIKTCRLYVIKFALINFPRIQFLSNMYQMHNNVFVSAEIFRKTDRLHWNSRRYVINNNPVPSTAATANFGASGGRQDDDDRAALQFAL